MHFLIALEAHLRVIQCKVPEKATRKAGLTVCSESSKKPTSEPKLTGAEAY